MKHYTHALYLIALLLCSASSWALSGSGWSCDNDQACSHLFSCTVVKTFHGLGEGAPPSRGDQLHSMLAVMSTPSDTLEDTFAQEPFTPTTFAPHIHRRFEQNLIGGLNNAPPLSCMNHELRSNLVPLIEKDTKPGYPHVLAEDGYVLEVSGGGTITIDSPLVVDPGDSRDMIIRGLEPVLIEAAHANVPCGIIIRSPRRVILENISFSGFQTGVCVEEGQLVLHKSTVRKNQTGVRIAGGSPSGASTLVESQIESNSGAGLHITDTSPVVMIGSGITFNGASFQFDAGSETRFYAPALVKLDHMKHHRVSNLIGAPLFVDYDDWRSSTPAYHVSTAAISAYSVPAYNNQTIAPIHIGFSPTQAVDHLDGARFDIALFSNHPDATYNYLVRESAHYKHIESNNMHYAQVPLMSSMSLTSMHLKNTLQTQKFMAAVNYLPSGVNTTLRHVIDDPEALAGEKRAKTIALVPVSYIDYIDFSDLPFTKTSIEHFALPTNNEGESSGSRINAEEMPDIDMNSRVPESRVPSTDPRVPNATGPQKALSPRDRGHIKLR